MTDSRKKDNKTTWVIDQLEKYGFDGTINMYDKFLEKFPDTSNTSFKVTVRREAKNLNMKSSKKIEKMEENAKRTYIKIFSKWCKRHKIMPKIKDLRDIDITKSVLDTYFGGNLDNLVNEAKALYPHRFKNFIDDRIWNSSRLRQLKDKIKKYKRFIITTAVGGTEVHEDFLSSIRFYCKKNNALLLLLVADNSLEELDDKLINENIVFSDVALNSNLYVSTIKILPKMIDPVTGMDRIGGKTGSFIFGSPKQRLTFVPQHNVNPVPHCLMTTGAITVPEYFGRKYYQKRTDYLANHDHKMGAIIVEIEDSKVFHFRQIQMDSNGGFVDLGKRYWNENVEEIDTEAIVLGDWHSGDTDPTVAKCWEQLSREIKAKRAVIHDGFNGASINHHEFNKPLERAKVSIEKKNDLKKELDNYIYDLNRFTDQYEEVLVVPSNHDRFLEKYLQSGMYTQDPQNHLISLDLAKQVILGQNPLEWYISRSAKAPTRIKWIKKDEHVDIEGVKVSDHGDYGANGSRGNLKGLEKTTSKGVFAHSHTPQILREAWQVGTSTYLRLKYTNGPGSWCNTSCAIYKGGSRQLINCINGKYKI